jgi:gamma-glutamyl-gamma-aminobutyrate hydrolase PuuD
LRPLVAVTARHLRPGRIASWAAGAVALPRGYTDALTTAGAHPVLLAPPGDEFDDADGAAMLAPFAGLVLSGGADVDPSWYGEEPHPAAYGIDRSLDRFEFALIRAALARGVALLAICRGHQVLNVALGGSLDQHITDRPGLLVHGDPAHGPGGGVDHEVTIEPGTKLAKAIGVERATVRSHHHQAVARLADGTTANAWADDGIVEGFELADGWAVAVQWHPEATAAADPVQQRLFAAFVAQCA